MEERIERSSMGPEQGPELSELLREEQESFEAMREAQRAVDEIQQELEGLSPAERDTEENFERFDTVCTIRDISEDKWLRVARKVHAFMGQSQQ